MHVHQKCSGGGDTCCFSRRRQRCTTATAGQLQCDHNGRRSVRGCSYWKMVSATQMQQCMQGCAACSRTWGERRLVCSRGLHPLSNNLEREQYRLSLPLYECRPCTQRALWLQPADKQDVSMRKNGIRQRGPLYPDIRLCLLQEDWNKRGIMRPLGRSDGGSIDCCFAVVTAAVGASAGAAFVHLIRAGLGCLGLFRPLSKLSW